MLMRIITLLMAFLLFTIPFASASSLITITESHGQDNIEGYIKSDDTYTARLRIDPLVGASAIDLNNIVFNPHDGVTSIFTKPSFQSCTVVNEGGNNVNYCTYSDSLKSSISEGEYDYKAILYVGDSIYSDDVKITIDSTPPNISNPLVDYIRGDVIVSAKFEDSSSGIRNIKILTKHSEDDGSKWKILFQKNYVGVNVVELNEIINFIPSIKGSQDIRIIYSDGLHELNYDVEKYMDPDSPEIINCMIGQDEEYFNYGQLNSLSVICNVKDNDPSLSFILDNVPSKDKVIGTCVCNSGSNCNNLDFLKEYNCSWSGDVNLEEGKQYTIFAIVEDSSGNKDQRTLQLNIAIDSEKPVFKGRFYSQGETLILNENKEEVLVNFVKNGDGNTLYALFSDDKSGVKESSIVLDNGDIRSDRCEKNGNEYLCIWENVNFNNNVSGYISSVEDYAGNKIGPALTVREFVIDNTDPSFVRAEAYSSITNLDVIGMGEKIRLIVVANDTGSGVWKIELPDFDEKYEDVCFPDGNNSRCVISTSVAFFESGSQDLRIKVYDKAGNSVASKLRINVAEKNIQNLDIWEFDNYKITPSEGLDEKIISKYPQRVLVVANLNKIIQGAFSVSGVELVKCSGDISYFNNQPSIFKMDAGASLLFETNPKYFSTNIPNNLSLTCEIKVYSSSRSITFSEPNKITVNFEVPINEFVSHEGLLLVEDKIESLQKDIESFEWLSTLNDLVKWSRFACDLRNSLQKLNSLLLALGYTFGILTSQPYTYSVGVSGCMMTSSLNTGLIDSVLGFMDQPCKFISCQIGTFETLDKLDVFGVSGFLKKSESFEKLKGGASEIGNNFADQVDHIDKNTIYGNTSVGRYSQYGKAIGMNFQTDPYSNVYMALMKFCLPALVWNAEKLKQIYCQELYCLKNDVKNNLATPEVCSSIRSYSICKYFVGPAAMIFLGPLQGLVDFVKDLATDYVGLVSWFFKILQNRICNPSTCSSGYNAICRTMFFTFQAIDVANDAINLYNQFQGLQGEDICDLALKD